MSLHAFHTCWNCLTAVLNDHLLFPIGIATRLGGIEQYPDMHGISKQVKLELGQRLAVLLEQENKVQMNSVLMQCLIRSVHGDSVLQKLMKALIRSSICRNHRELSKAMEP